MASLPPAMDIAIRDQLGAGLRDLAASFRTAAGALRALRAALGENGPGENHTTSEGGSDAAP